MQFVQSETHIPKGVAFPAPVVAGLRNLQLLPVEIDGLLMLSQPVVGNPEITQGNAFTPPIADLPVNRERLLVVLDRAKVVLPTSDTRYQ